MGEISILTPYLGRFGRRLRLRDGWLLAQRTLWLAAAAALLIQIAGRFFPIENLWAWMLAPLAAWLVVNLGWALFRRMAPMHIARRVDLELHLKERLSTTLALGQVNKDDPYQLISRQREDALHWARTIQPGRAFPLPWLRRELVGAAVLAGLAAVSVFLPNPMDLVLAERANVREAAAEQAERIEELREEIAKEELTPEEREQLLRELAELANQLKENPGSLEEALADISRLEQSLRERVDLNAGARQQALAQLSEQLRNLAQQEGQEGEPADVSEALKDLAEQLANQELQERQETAQALSQMASRAAMSGDQQLAQALASLAQAAQSGDPSELASASESVQEALENAEGELADQDAIQQILDQLAQSSQRMSQSGQMANNSQPGDNTSGQPGSQPGSQPGNQPGSQPGNQPGNQPGSQPGSQPGQGNQAGTGGGSQANTLPPATRPGQAGNPTGTGQNTSLEDFQSQVYVPFDRRPENGQELFVPGQDTGQGETQVKESQSPLPGSSSQALVPYYDVMSSYLNAANQAVDQGHIPAGLREFVREYFSQLEP